MRSRYQLKCNQCNKSEEFEDEHSIRQAHWKVIAWNVKTGDPVVICNDCLKKADK